jgi:hypothetical protein
MVAGRAQRRRELSGEQVDLGGQVETPLPRITVSSMNGLVRADSPMQSTSTPRTP